LTPAPKKISGLKIVFRGVRGSYPASGDNFKKYGGNTTCFEIWAGDCLIIIDAGTGIVNLGKDLADQYFKSGKDLESRTPVEAIMLFSHVHLDHLMGFPFFAPLHFPDSTFYIFGPDVNGYSFENSIGLGLQPPLFPIALRDFRALKLFRSLLDVESIFWSSKKGIPYVVNNFREYERKKQTAKDNPVHISCLKSYAHPQGVFVYKIEYKGKSVVVATDVEGYVYGDTRLIEFSKGCDLLIHDAGYTKEAYINPIHCTQGYGHSTVEMAAEVAAKAKVKELALVHHEPVNDDNIVDDLDKQCKTMFKNSYAAKEGHVVEL